MNQSNHSVTFVPVEFDPFSRGVFSCAVPAIEPQKEIFASVLLGGDDANCSYNESISLRLTGPFNHSAMASALQELINRHEALRSCFSTDGNELFVYKELPTNIYEQDLSGLNREEQKIFIEQYCKKEAAMPFNLLDGPLFRISLFRLANEDHYLTLMTHHIICDGWSIGTLLQDLSKLYTAYSKNEEPYLGEAAPYSQYAIEQLEFSSTREFKEIEQYWINQYKNDVPLLDLATDFPRPELKTYKGRRDDFKLEPQLINSIKKLGARAGCSFVTSFLIAFEVFLHRLTGQHSFILGLPAAGQSATANYDLVGHCVNLLPLRCEVNEDKSFVEFLASRKPAILDAYEHQLFTFGSLLKKVRLPRDTSRVPLVPVVFNIDVNLDKDVRFFNLKHELISNPRVYENFEIFLNIMGSEEALTFEWSYNTQLFTPATIAKMMDGFRHMLNAITEDEKLRIKDIPITDHNKAINWQDQWNQTKSDYPKTKALHHLISERAEQYPNAVALQFNKESITYGELDIISSQFATLLIENGIQTGDTVALALDRSEKTVISLLAIMKSGAAYVPLDPEYPAERLQFMLQDSESKILLTSKKYQGRFHTSSKELIIEDIWPKLSSYSKDVNVGVTGKDLAYILYTSGSTGKPKGVQIEHHSLINLLYATRKLLSVGKGDKLFSVTTISFDISGLEMYLPLISGASVIIADDITVKDGYLLLQAIRSVQPTIMQATPSTWRLLLEAEWKEDLSIKTICCGGEALPMDLAKKLLARSGSVFNMYGPTETTIWSTVKKVEIGEDVITIGYPIDNTEIYILDKSGQAVPQNTVGEIYIGGDGLARGYLNRPELDAEKFTNNPFAKNKETKLYRTGDLGRFLSNGEIQCLGRIDHQVKIRGHRIELEEIEQCLVQHDNIKQALVVVKQKSPGDQRLVAYVITDSDKKHIDNKSKRKWKELLKGSLPSYMVPNDIIVLDAFPLTPNGKIDRKRLPEPELNLEEKEKEFIAPRSNIERMIAAIWTELLGVQRISVQDNFFELGGHSLIAAQLMIRLEKVTSRRLPLTEIFRFSTLEQFASLFQDNISADADCSSVKDTVQSQTESKTTYVPVTESQMEIWLSCIIGGDDANRSYNLSISEWLEGKLDRFLIERAIQDLVDRHESLRMTFSEDGKNICIHDNYKTNLYFEDLIKYTPNQQQTFIDAFSKQNAVTTFDLLTGPLFRVSLFKLSDEKYYLTLAVHHIICDGWSLGILLKELSILYSAYAKGEVPDLPKAPLYSKYAAEQRLFGESETCRKAEQFWVDLYKNGAPTLNLSTDFPRPQNRTYKSRRDDYPLDRKVIAQIQRIGTQAGCSIAISLRAAFEIFMYQLTGQNDIVLGLPAAGQLVSGNYDLVGHCVNLLPIRSKLTGKPSFIQYLQERKASILDAYNHQQFTFGSLLKKLNIPRDRSRIPLVPVVFNIEMGMDDGVSFHGIRNTMVFNPKEYETFDIFLNIGGTDEAPTLEWSYNTQLFTAATIKKLMNDFELLLKTIAINPNVMLSDIIFNKAGDAYQKQQNWNDTQVVYPKNKALHQLISEQAKKHPKKLAVHCNGSKVTYEELDKVSNQLAAFLIAKGIQIGDTIGLALDRSITTVISLLAVMKTGGIYVPLDPEFPKDRVEFMLEDSCAKLVLISKKYKGHFITQAKEIVIEDIWTDLSGYTSGDVAVNVTGADLAYILYTSGSTGKPKGVQIEHHSLVNFLCSMQKNLCIKSEDKLLAVTTISFDISGMEIYLPLISGSILLFLDTQTTKDGYLLLETIQSDKPTIMQATPATWKMLIEVGWTEEFCINTICCGGEALSKDLADKLVKRSKALYNLYGPTETTIWSTCKKINQNDDLITIGRPIDNTQVYILDESMRPLPENSIGEIYIGGDGVARGYWKRPELTDERFISNPFSKSMDKIYKTGDLGKFLSNGEIQCLGRIDHQVKIRGYRIELEEIEHWFLQQEGVKQIVVSAREDAPGDQRLVAYIVLNTSVKDTKEYLAKWRKNIKDALPSYMAPNDFVFLKKLPLTPNGKIDRNALPKPEYQIAIEKTLLKFISDTEEKIAGLWKEILGIENIAPDDNFFELGGHSLVAIRLTNAIEKKLGVRFPLSILFQHPTIRSLALKIDEYNKPGNEESKSHGSWKCLVPIKSKGSKTPLYVIHGAGLNILFLNTLAANMHPDQPVFGLQGIGITGDKVTFNSVEEIATIYIKEILEQNPNGSYAIAGFSMGAIIAFEIAKQLSAVGKDVRFLGILDAHAGMSCNLVQKKGLGQKIRFFIKQQVYGWNLLFKHPIMKIWQIQHFFYLELHRLFHIMLYKTKINPSDTYYFINKSSKKYRKAISTYKPDIPYNGAIDLFKTKKQHYYLEDLQYFGWKPHTLKGINVHLFEGDHNKLFESPVVEELAATLQHRLNETNDKVFTENLPLKRMILQAI